MFYYSAKRRHVNIFNSVSGQQYPDQRGLLRSELPRDAALAPREGADLALREGAADLVLREGEEARGRLDEPSND